MIPCSRMWSAPRRVSRVSCDRPGTRLGSGANFTDLQRNKRGCYFQYDTNFYFFIFFLKAIISSLQPNKSVKSWLSTLDGEFPPTGFGRPRTKKCSSGDVLYPLKMTRDLSATTITARTLKDTCNTLCTQHRNEYFDIREWLRQYNYQAIIVIREWLWRYIRLWLLLENDYDVI